MNCKNCGSPLTGVETLCPMCGFQVAVYGAQTPTTGTVPAQSAAPAQGMQNPQAMSTDVGAQQVVNAAPEMPVGGVPEMPVGQPTMPPQPAPVPAAMPASMPGPVPMPEAAPLPAPVPTPIDPAVVSSVSQNTAPAQVNPMPVDANQAAPTPVVVDPMTVNGVVQQPAAPEMMANQNIAQPQNPMGGGAQMQAPVQSQPQSLTADKEKKPKAGNKRQTILLIILALCIVGAIVYYVFIYPEGSTTSGGSGGSGKETNEVSTKPKDVTASVGGYTFTIPDGFIAEEGDKQLTVTSYDTAYIFGVDYTNNLDAYKTAFLASNPQLATTLENTYFDRNYLLVGYTATDGTNGVNFVSPASDKAVFVGTVLKNGGVAPIPDDYSDLTTIINSAVVDSSNSVKAGDSSDLGSNGFYTSNMSASSITFNSN